MKRRNAESGDLENKYKSIALETALKLILNTPVDIAALYESRGLKFYGYKNESRNLKRLRIPFSRGQVKTGKTKIMYLTKFVPVEYAGTVASLMKLLRKDSLVSKDDFELLISQTPPEVHYSLKNMAYAASGLSKKRLKKRGI